MAQYFTDFREYVADAEPSDWSKPFDNLFTAEIKDNASVDYPSLNYTGDKYLRLLSTSNEYNHVLVWDLIDSDPNRDDVEVLIRFRQPYRSVTSSNVEIGQAIRIQGIENSETFYSLAWGLNISYELESLSLMKYVSGSYTFIDYTNFTPFSADLDYFYWIKLTISGSTLTVKMWIDGIETEVDARTVSVTDTSITGNGSVGLQFEDLNKSTYHIDRFGVGTNGDFAPSEKSNYAEPQTDEATNIGAGQAQLNGQIVDYDGISSADAYFEYREVGAATWTEVLAQSGMTGVGAFNKNITGLSINTDYEFRAKLKWTFDTENFEDEGIIKTFTTLSAPEPAPISPNLTTIDALLIQQFTWDSGITNQDSYELRYRLTGGTWTTTGRITSVDEYHNFASDTFNYQEEYEWQIKIWEDTGIDIIESSWSSSNTFDTIINPTISETNPTDSSEIEIGIINLGAKVISHYGLDVELQIEIADNDSYTDSEIFNINYVSSGERAEIEHAVTAPGVYYVKMIATDTEGIESEILEYSFSTTQSIYYIEDPSVTLKSPQATEITVSSATNSVTVDTTDLGWPAVSADKKIQKRIEIDEDIDAAGCQEIGETLLGKWGKESKTVVGVVDLTVTTTFKNKIRIINVEAGIDEEMILQRKEHNITESKTTLVCGDIVISDNELLSRLLEELS